MEQNRAVWQTISVPRLPQGNGINYSQKHPKKEKKIIKNISDSIQKQEWIKTLQFLVNVWLNGII